MCGHISCPAWKQKPYSLSVSNPGKPLLAACPISIRKGVIRLANFNVQLAKISEQEIPVEEFLAHLRWLESLGHQVNVSASDTKCLIWLTEQTKTYNQEREKRSMAVRLTIGTVAATAAILFGTVGLML